MPTINGQSYQHATVDLRAAGTGGEIQFQTFKSLDFESGAEKEGVSNSQGEQTGYTHKPTKTAGKFVLLLDEYPAYYAWLMQQAALLRTTYQQPFGPGQVEFDLTVTFGVVLSKLVTRRLKQCLQVKEAFSSKDDQNALVMECPLFVTRVEDDQGRAWMEYRQK